MKLFKKVSIIHLCIGLFTIFFIYLIINQSKFGFGTFEGLTTNELANDKHVLDEISPFVDAWMKEGENRVEKNTNLLEVLKMERAETIMEINDELINVDLETVDSLIEGVELQTLIDNYNKTEFLINFIKTKSMSERWPKMRRQ